MAQSPATDLSTLKVADLRSLLAEKGLSTSGKKTELIERLQAVAMPPAAASLAASSSAASNRNSGSSATAATPVGAPSEAPVAPLAADAVTHPVAKPPEKKTASAAPSLSGTSPVSPVVITATMTEEEKRAARKAKFGIKSDEDKMHERARRFGVSDPTLEEEKKRQRAQRFGLSVTASAGGPKTQLSVEEAEKRRKRAERFGITDEEERKRRRAERFGILSEEEKLQKRLQRFASSATA